MAEDRTGQSQQIADRLFRETAPAGEQGRDALGQGGSQLSREISAEAHQLFLQCRKTGLGSRCKLRQDPGQCPQLTDRKRAQKHPRHSQKAKGDAHADPGSDLPGDPDPAAKESGHGLRAHSQGEPQQKGQYQGQKVAQCQPCDQERSGGPQQAP